MKNEREYVARIDVGQDCVLVYRQGANTSLVVTTRDNGDAEVVLTSDQCDGVIAALRSCRQRPRGAKTLEDAKQLLAEDIAITLSNPAMWAGEFPGASAFAVDVVLGRLCLLWKTIEGRPREYHTALDKMLASVGCVDDSTDPPTTHSLEHVYRRSNPNATENQVIAHVVENWRTVVAALDIPICTTTVVATEQTDEPER
jgi:ketosteroid isomerase-like protein